MPDITVTLNAASIAAIDADLAGRGDAMTREQWAQQQLTQIASNLRYRGTRRDAEIIADQIITASAETKSTITSLLAAERQRGGGGRG